MKRRNGLKKGGKRMPPALWIAIGAAFLCAAAATYYKKK